MCSKGYDTTGGAPAHLSNVLLDHLADLAAAALLLTQQVARGQVGVPEIANDVGALRALAAAGTAQYENNSVPTDSVQALLRAFAAGTRQRYKGYGLVLHREYENAIVYRRIWSRRSCGRSRWEHRSGAKGCALVKAKRQAYCTQSTDNDRVTADAPLYPGPPMGVRGGDAWVAVVQSCAEQGPACALRR
jgi:hypothetical protein